MGFFLKTQSAACAVRSEIGAVVSLRDEIFSKTMTIAAIGLLASACGDLAKLIDAKTRDVIDFMADAMPPDPCGTGHFLQPEPFYFKAENDGLADN